MPYAFMQKLSSKSSLLVKAACTLGLIILAALFVFYFLQTKNYSSSKPIVVGVLFSHTGVMAATERPILRATLLAIDEINQKGGVAGRPIHAVVYDSQSNWQRTSQLAEHMIEQDKVEVIFGGFTSAARKAIKTVVEKYDNLLMYSVSYEGIEDSKNIVYLGMAPNQQLIPAIAWMVEQKGGRVYLLGSDYIWPRIANIIISHETRLLGSEVVATRYLALGDSNVQAIIEDIKAKKPDFILSTLVGSSNIAFLNQLYDTIPEAERPPLMSFGIVPAEAKNRIKGSKFVGLHSVWSYYKSLKNPENQAFLQAYAKKYGSSDEVDDPAATSYTAVYLWAQTVFESPTTLPSKVRENMLRQSIASPAGVIYIDPSNANAWRSVFIERINEAGKPEIVWSSSTLVEPITYPEFKSKAEWDLLEYQLYLGWGRAWEKS